MAVAPLPRNSLEDVRHVLRALYGARRDAGATEAEIRRLSNLGDDVLRLVRRTRLGDDAKLWVDSRHILRLVLRLCADLPVELRPGVLALLEAAAKPVLRAPEQPGEGTIATMGTKPER